MHLALFGSAQGLGRGAALALGGNLRRDLARALSDVPEARAIVLSVEGWDWTLDEDRTGDAVGAGDDGWAGICARLAQSRVPVIATMSGAVAGDGLAPVLAAHYVIAQAEARLSLPQSGLGRLPAGGALGALAVRVGAARALDLVLGRRSIGARRALALGVVDSVSVPDPEGAAKGMARLIASGRQGLPPRSPSRVLSDPDAYLDAVAAARAHLSAMRPARARLVARAAEVVEAQLLLSAPVAAAFEADAWAAQRADPAAAALGHLAWAAREAAQGLPQPVPSTRLQSVAVLGGTTLAADLAHALITAGLSVTLVTPEGPALAECLRQIAVAQDGAVRQGQISAERREQDWARLQAGLDPTRAAGADLILDASDLTDSEAAHALSRAAAVARRGALRVTARCRDLALLDDRTGRHGLACGFHVCDPLASGHLAEIVLPGTEGGAPAALSEALAMLSALSLRLGRIGIRVRRGAAGLADRFRQEGLAAVRSGLAAGLPGAALHGALSDLGWSLPLAQVMPDPHPAPRHLQPSDPDRTRWQAWLVARLANLGAALIEEGVLSSPAEVDLVLCEGAGMARDTGGPMHMADAIGLVRLRALLRQQADAGDAAAAPRALWTHYIRNARHFTGSDLQVLVAGGATA